MPVTATARSRCSIWMRPMCLRSKIQYPPAAKTRVDEMALTTDGEWLLTVNNAEDPPYANLFSANGDRSFNSVQKLTKITIDATLFPKSPAIEQPTWDPKTKRFYVSGAGPWGKSERVYYRAPRQGYL